VSIGIFSYLNTMTFGINADFDAFPDLDVLAGGIRGGIEELLRKADKAGPATRPAAAPAKTAPAKTAPAKRATAKKAPAKKSTATRAAAAGQS
jgi:hypothetical protein